MKTTLALVFLFSSTCLVAQTSEYIGYKYKPVLPEKVLPNGVKSLGGGVVFDGDQITKYGVGHFRKGGSEMLWLEIVTKEDEKGPTEWEVKDVLTFPLLTKNQELFIPSGNESCTVNGKNDEKLVVFAAFAPRTMKYTVHKAWRVDLKTEKFNSIPLADIRCIYDAP